MKSKKYDNNMDFLVSIIVPVYNVEPYIRRCLDSIINQTYKNIEIILVDDGSTDNSGLICDEYSSKDNRIKVIHKKNGGLSSARNVGLDFATGDYIGFVDSDDFIEYNFIEKMLEHNNNCDVIMCRFRKIGNNLSFVPVKYNYCNNFVFLNGAETLKLILLEQLDCSCCTKLFKKEIARNIHFQNGKTNEDFGALHTLLLKCSKILYIKDILYNYITREGSITTTSFSERQFDKLENAYNCLCNIKYSNKKIKKYAWRYYYIQNFYIYKRLLFDSKYKIEFRSQFRHIRNVLCFGLPYLLVNNLFDFRFKGSIIYSLLFPDIYVYLHKNNIL